jgi:hypothetical protein
MKALCHGGGTLPDKEQPFIFPTGMNTGSLLEIKSIGQ